MHHAPSPDYGVALASASSLPVGRTWPNRETCHRHALDMIVSRSDEAALKLIICLAADGSATRIGGSPARRSLIAYGTGRPATAAMAFRTCFTEYPWPEPRLQQAPSWPPNSACNALTWAAARSTTWM